ncbi:phospholipase [Lottiidibacillus patelloidae]|uniref:Phospholipase n=1 Tax=Lottiidibacillus patelloidae TaxID=2670334 RepID=A0A263BTT7_9BACI|nr:phospholipase [Lottiidibacillus patelloidae]OZM56978.1 phospholipase [Lottiidibacillus patelloidae]
MFRFCIFPGYKWCGPGCSGPGAPINRVDAACKMHDECYQYYGDKCYCDQVFIQQLRPLVNPYTVEGRHADLIYGYMKLHTFFTCRF